MLLYVVYVISDMGYYGELGRGVKPPEQPYFLLYFFFEGSYGYYLQFFYPIVIKIF